MKKSTRIIDDYLKAYKVEQKCKVNISGRIFRECGCGQYLERVKIDLHTGAGELKKDALPGQGVEMLKDLQILFFGQTLSYLESRTQCTCGRW